MFKHYSIGPNFILNPNALFFPLRFNFLQSLGDLLGDHRTIAPCPIINDKIHLLSPPDPLHNDLDCIVDHYRVHHSIYHFVKGEGLYI